MVNPVDPSYSPDPSSLRTSSFGSTRILNKIFSLVLKMIETLQEVAASQASRLTIYSAWQKDYTEAISKVPVLVEGSDPFPNIGSTARQSLNTAAQSAITNLQNRQSVVSDDAKALQSNVNQSNDAVNQQSNLGTAILQQLNALVGAIFR